MRVVSQRTTGSQTRLTFSANEAKQDESMIDRARQSLSFACFEFVYFFFLILLGKSKSGVMQRRLFGNYMRKDLTEMSIIAFFYRKKNFGSDSSLLDYLSVLFFQQEHIV